MKSPKKKAKEKAWATFSKYIRLKSSRNGYATCYTCGIVKHWKELQAGHGIGGRNNSVLFLEEIVKPQCVGCNVFGRGKYAVFTRKLIDELGLEEYDRIVTESNQVRKYSEMELKEMESQWSAYVKQFDKQVS